MRYPDGLPIVRLITAAVGDHQFAVRALCRVDHLLAFSGSVGHRLFAKHVLARLEATDRVFGVHAVGKNDVDDVHVRVIFDRIVILVVVDILRTDSIAQREFIRLVWMAAYKRHDLRLLAFGERGKDLMDGKAAQAYDGPAQFLSRRARNCQLCRSVLQQAPGEVGSD